MPRRLASVATATALAAIAVPAVAVASAGGMGGGAAMSSSAASAQSPSAGEATSFTAAFTTRRPGTPTGVRLRTTGLPPAPPATVPPVVRQTVTFPAGTRLNVGAFPQCTAADDVIAAEGAEAVCPPESRIGTGRAEGVLSGATVRFDLGIYAVRGRVFFAGERDGVPLKQGFFGVATGRRLALTVPTANGAIAPTLFEARIPATTAGRPWLRTPPRCPRAGAWVSRATFQGLTAVDGTPVGAAQTLRGESPCRMPTPSRAT
jgi:hypothetical protein